MPPVSRYNLCFYLQKLQSLHFLFNCAANQAVVQLAVIF